MRPQAHRVEYRLAVVKITLSGRAGEFGTVADVLDRIAALGINLSAISSATTADASWRLSITVSSSDALAALNAARSTAVGMEEPRLEEGFAWISLFSASMRSSPGYASAMFRALERDEIPVDMVVVSDASIGCLIPETRVQDGLRALRRAFRLDR